MKARALSPWAGRVVLALIIIGLLIPVYWLLKSSLSSYNQLFQNPPQLLPVPPTGQGFVQALPGLETPLLVSLAIAIGCVVVSLAVSLPTAYGLMLLRSGRGGGVSRLIVLSTLMFPSVMFVIPLYNLFYRAGLLNTIWGLMIADSIYAVPLAILVLYTYMLTIEPALLEAAVIDGANTFRVFLTIVVPLARPAVMTSAIFAFLFGWGDYLFAVTFGAGRGLSTATVAISALVGGSQGVVIDWPEVMAGGVVLAIPALIAIIAAQRFITSGLSVGAVK